MRSILKSSLIALRFLPECSRIRANLRTDILRDDILGSICSERRIRNRLQMHVEIASEAGIIDQKSFDTFHASMLRDMLTIFW